MAKDKRSKGCPNAECIRNQKKYHYKVTDQYCTICGSKLVLVCQDCFQKLADLGPKHVRCNSCAAEREDRKHRPEKRIKHIAGEATEFAKDAAKQAKDLGAGLLDGVKDYAQHAREKAETPEEKQQIMSLKELLNTKIVAAWETRNSFYLFPENDHEFDETMYRIVKNSGKVEEMGYLDFALTTKARAKKIDPSIIKKAFGL